MKEIVEIIAKSLVDHPDQVVIDEKDGEHMTVFELHVASDDMGKVIGKQGKIKCFFLCKLSQFFR